MNKHAAIDGSSIGAGVGAAVGGYGGYRLGQNISTNKATRGVIALAGVLAGGAAGYLAGDQVDAYKNGKNGLDFFHRNAGFLLPAGGALIGGGVGLGASRLLTGSSEGSDKISDTLLTAGGALAGGMLGKELYDSNVNPLVKSRGGNVRLLDKVAENARLHPEKSFQEVKEMTIQELKRARLGEVIQNAAGAVGSSYKALGSGVYVTSGVAKTLGGIKARANTAKILTDPKFVDTAYDVYRANRGFAGSLMSRSDFAEVLRAEMNSGTGVGAGIFGVRPPVPDATGLGETIATQGNRPIDRMGRRLGYSPKFNPMTGQRVSNLSRFGKPAGKIALTGAGIAALVATLMDFFHR